MQEIILPSEYIISRHAAQRFLERIIERDPYTQEDKDVAIVVIRNILSNRALKFKRLDKSQVQIKYHNALFVYDTEVQAIITVYPDSNSKEKVEWTYNFPSGLKFKGNINSDTKARLITEGFIPVRKDGRTLIGEKDNKLYQYDYKYNIVWQVKK